MTHHSTADGIAIQKAQSSDQLSGYSTVCDLLDADTTGAEAGTGMTPLGTTAHDVV